MKNSASAGSTRRWFFKGGMAILDQGIFSGANFVLNVVLARWLVPEQYGAYAIGFSVLIFFLQFLFSFILDPMAVLGPSLHSDELQVYLASQIRIYFGLMIMLGLLQTGVMIFGKAVGWNPIICNILTVIGASLVFLLFPWILRRIFYVLGSPAKAVEGSVVYATTLVIMLYLIKRLGFLTDVSSVLVVAFAGLICGIYLMFKLGWSTVLITDFPVMKTLSENWNFGRWLMLSGVLTTAAGQVQIYIAGGVLGLKETGVVYALQTISQPMTLSITAVSALIIPSLASDYAKGEMANFNRKSFVMTLALTAMAVIFIVLLYLFKTPLEYLIYGGKFSNYVDLIPVWALSPLITSMVSGMQCSLLASNRPYSILFASFFWLPTSIGLGIFMAHYWGLWGLAISTVSGYLVLGLVLAFLYWFWLGTRS